MTQTAFSLAIDCRYELTSNTAAERIAYGQLFLLLALLNAEDSLGSMDGATADLVETFDADGRLRNQIPRGLARDGIVAEVETVHSRQTRQDRARVRRWRLVDAVKAKRKVDALLRWIDAQKNPLTAATVAGGESSDRSQSVANSALSLPDAKESGQ